MNVFDIEVDWIVGKYVLCYSNVVKWLQFRGEGAWDTPSRQQEVRMAQTCYFDIDTCALWDSNYIKIVYTYM